jgi:hypothetical protein
VVSWLRARGSRGRLIRESVRRARPCLAGGIGLATLLSLSTVAPAQTPQGPGKDSGQPSGSPEEKPPAPTGPATAPDGGFNVPGGYRNQPTENERPGRQGSQPGEFPTKDERSSYPAMEPAQKQNR